MWTGRPFSGDAHFDGRVAEAVADERGVEVDVGIAQRGIADGDAEHFAIFGDRRRAEADGEHGDIGIRAGVDGRRDAEDDEPVSAPSERRTMPAMRWPL